MCSIFFFYLQSCYMNTNKRLDRHVVPSNHKNRSQTMERHHCLIDMKKPQWHNVNVAYMMSKHNYIRWIHYYMILILLIRQWWCSIQTLLTATGIADAVGKQFLTQTKSHSPPFKVRSFPPSYKNMK